MAISVLLLIICAIVLGFLIPHSKYGLPMFFIICGVILSTISVLFQYYSSSSYIPPAYLPFRQFDIFLYRNAGQSFRIPLRTMQILRNSGVVTYLLGISSLLDSIKRNLKENLEHSSFISFLSSKVCFVILCFLYISFYSSYTAYHAYLKYHMADATMKQNIAVLFTCIHSLFNAIILIYMFFPLFLLAYHTYHKNVTCFTGTIIIIMVSISLINAGFYQFVFTSFFRNSTNHVFRTGFWFFNRITRIPPVLISIYPLFALIILIFIILSINGFFALDMLSYSRNRLLKKQIDDLNYNLKDVFHSEKNLMFSINILANEALTMYGSEESKQKLQRILDISNQQMHSLSESLTAIKQLHIKPGAVDLKEITDSAISQITIPDDIKIKTDYCSFEVSSTLDPYHTSHAIMNLIMNSIDSLSMVQDKEKEIVITINASKEWVYWSLFDNGIGMTHKQARKMMMPFASTKSKNTNWGIGLPYAFRVISSQLGQMRITGSTDKNDHHALVEILLPRRN